MSLRVTLCLVTGCSALALAVPYHCGKLPAACSGTPTCTCAESLCQTPNYMCQTASASLVYCVFDSP
jgi:hypothetical protein